MTALIPDDLRTLTTPLAAFEAKVECITTEAVHLFGRCTDNGARLRATHRVAELFRSAVEGGAS